MNEAIELAKDIIRWWRSAQFTEAYPGCNLYNEDPVFVTKAFQLLDEVGIDYSGYMCFSEPDL